MSRHTLARKAVRAAAKLRRDFSVLPNGGLCPFDIGRQLGISMRIVSLPSLEGMYSPSPSLAIVVSCERPAGRRRYTCAHELGHHVFEHGVRIDELDDSNSAPWSEEEYLAQRFASALLMPKLAVDSLFAQRGWSIGSATAKEFYLAAQELGVGYTTLLTHLAVNTKQITRASADTLKKVSQAKIRKEICGFDPPKDVFQLAETCIRARVDIEVGDVLLLPEQHELEGSCLARASGGHYEAVAVGVAAVELPGGQQSIEARVSRRDFVGLAHYRFLPEEDDE